MPVPSRSIALGACAVAVLLCTCVARVTPTQKDADADPRDGGKEVAVPEVAGQVGCASMREGNAGCSFYAAEPVTMENPGACYAMVVVNPGTQAARLKLERGPVTFPIDRVARLPRGGGTTLTYQPFNNLAGLAPGDVALVFLAGPGTGVGPDGTPGLGKTGCPLGITAASDFSTNKSQTSHLGEAFHLTSDRPVVAYDINPFGGAFSYVASATLLLPEEAWSGNYVAAVPLHPAVADAPLGMTWAKTFLLVVAGRNETEVTLRAPVPITGGDGVSEAGANQLVHLRLQAGQFVQVMERRWDLETAFSPGMSGTIISSNKPVGLIGGIPCFTVPVGTGACDAAHQQIPPVSAWGSEYAAVRPRTRIAALEEAAPWQLVAAVDGTVLTYAPRAPAPSAEFPTPAPTTLAAGQSVQFWTADPFVVRSQDAAHPFFLAGLMTGGAFLDKVRTDAERGAGDPEFVNAVPTDQYMNAYTFFTDPTYSETSLVVVRKPGADGRFGDVRLGCASAPIAGWSDLGPLQYARVDLVTGRYQPVIAGCDNGPHKITSTGPFGVTVWGWNTTAINNLLGTFGPNREQGGYVSYAYPAGAGLARISDVIIVP